MKAMCTLVLAMVIVSCVEENTKLERALELAGENRKELERVLTHYSHTDADSLKLRAACFLIENMPGALHSGRGFDKCVSGTDRQGHGGFLLCQKGNGYFFGTLGSRAETVISGGGCDEGDCGFFD